MKTDQNDFAFARRGEFSNQNGLTKREYIAIAMMRELVYHYTSPQSAAQHAIRATDALITELNKETE